MSMENQKNCCNHQKIDKPIKNQMKIVQKKTIKICRKIGKTGQKLTMKSSRNSSNAKKLNNWSKNYRQQVIYN